MNSPDTPLFHNLVHLGGASGFVGEIHEVVSVLSIFEGFTLPEYSLLCDYMECFAAPGNVTILREDDVGDFLLILLTGGVDVIKAAGHDEKKVVTRVGPGAFLGEMSLIDGMQRFASCVTTQPADFAVLTRERLNLILADHPKLGNKVLLLLLQLMTLRLRDTTTRMLPTIASELI